MLERKKRKKSKKNRQKNKRGYWNRELNDSPEIPDRGVTSDIPGLPWGALHEETKRCAVSKHYFISSFFSLGIEMLKFSCHV